MSSNIIATANSTSAASAVSYAAAAATLRSPTPVKYVPLHRRPLSDTASQRSASPTPSDASTSTLVDSTAPQPQKSRVYNIATLLQLSHEPEVKLISLERREVLKQTLPEIVMNRKLRKMTEFHVIQERAKTRPQVQRDTTPQQVAQGPNPPRAPITSSQQQQRQRPGQRRQPRAIGTERRRNASKVVDEASWRTLRPLRLPAVAV